MKKEEKKQLELVKKTVKSFKIRSAVRTGACTYNSAEFSSGPSGCFCSKSGQVNA